MQSVSMRHRAGLVLLIVLAALLAFGCYEYETDPALVRICETDEDLYKQGHFWEGVVCVDGRPKCPDGSNPCNYISTFGGKHTLVSGCLQECIACPIGTLICYYNNQKTGNISYYCGKDPRECFGDDDYVYLPDSIADCPTASKDCLMERD